MCDQFSEMIMTRWLKPILDN